MACVFGEAKRGKRMNKERFRTVRVVGLGLFLLAGSSGGSAFPWEIDPESVADQALFTAARQLEFPLPDVDLATGPVLGIEALPARQHRYRGPHGTQYRIVDDTYPRFEEPVRLRLSKRVYPAEDRHLDAIVWLSEESPPEEIEATVEGHVELAMYDAQGRRLAEGILPSPARAGTFFSMGLPDAVIGQDASLEAVWMVNGESRGRQTQAFRVEPPSRTARSGRIPLRVPNDSGATLQHAPFTVGVPFPRGALYEDRHVRLVDEVGREIPLQTRVTARWSRFGPVRWMLCDFTADLDGGPRELHLEYGPEIERGAPPRRGWFAGCRRQPAPDPARLAPIHVETAGGGFPAIEAGRLRASEDGVFYDLEGNGAFTEFLEGAALLGEFVEHENGRRYGVPADVHHAIEEHGSEKIVVRRTGWYRASDGTKFCNFITRLVFHRDSPVVRIYHTWIFTGDGNRDRIANMGWRFPLASGLDDRRLLTAFGEDGTWSGAGRLVQWNYEGYDLHADGGAREVSDGRAPGVALAGDGTRRLYFGAKDFWQNFPSEIGFDGDSFGFYNWPRHNRPASFERPVTPWTAYRHRFAHEGEVLDFRLPEEYGGEIGQAAMRVHRMTSRHYDPDNLESANAQGIARTEEMFVYLADAAVSPDEGARVLRGLNDETLRAVVDPVWMTASGVFGRIHPRDTANFPEDEYVYDLISHAPARWAEQLGVYGMWLFGDIPAWNMRLHRRESNPYRAYRKNHHGWPFRWTPFARSGDPRLLKYAEAATRQMTDANFCHFATPEVDASVGADHRRRQGWWHRSILPWAGSNRPLLRSYAVESDYLWDSYYLTGYRRGKDVALLWAERVKLDDARVPDNRVARSHFSSYLDTYQATFDPWFLVGVHALKDMHLDRGASGSPGFWRPADRKFIEFSGSPSFMELYRNEVDPDYRNWRHETGHGWHGWTLIEPHAFAWHLTRDEVHLQRLAHELDWARMAVYDGDVDYLRGALTQAVGSTPLGIFTGTYLQAFPFALAALAEAGVRPDPVPNTYHLSPVSEFLLLKEPGVPVGLYFQAYRPGGETQYPYEVIGPDGGVVKSGGWTASERREGEIPAEAPPGVYRLRFEQTPPRGSTGALYLPVAHRDVPEVFVRPHSENGTWFSSGGVQSQVWFRVPEGVDEFWIDVAVPADHARRVSIWNPDMERAWDLNRFGPEEGELSTRAVVRVAPEHAGKLWRITQPGLHGGFRIDPQIPPIFSVSRQKWFDPAEHGWPDDGAGAEP